MKPNDEEIVVEIEKEEEPQPAVEKAIEAGDTSKKPEDDGIEVIRAQVKEYETKLEAERAEKEAARQRAEAAEREVAYAKTKVSESELDVLSSAMSVAEVERENAKRELKDAMERGDFDGVVSANEKLSLAVSNLEKLKEGKIALERSKTEAPSSDPVENYISRFSPRSQEFLRKNLDYVKDPAKNKRLIAAHYEAEAEGYTPDTDAYFQFVDSKLKPKATPDRKTTPAAPVSRGGNDVSFNGNNSTESMVIKLTPGEARAAVDGSIVWNSGPKKGEPIGVKEYARRKSIMQRSGQYDNAY